MLATCASPLLSAARRSTHARTAWSSGGATTGCWDGATRTGPLALPVGLPARLAEGKALVVERPAFREPVKVDPGPWRAKEGLGELCRCASRSGSAALAFGSTSP